MKKIDDITKKIKSLNLDDYWTSYIELNVLNQTDIDYIQEENEKGRLFFAISTLRERNIDNTRIDYKSFKNLFDENDRCCLETIFKHKIQQWEVKEVHNKIEEDNNYLEKLFMLHKQYPYWLLGTLLTIKI